jgi:hypothetical protein
MSRDEVDWIIAALWAVASACSRAQTWMLLSTGKDMRRIVDGLLLLQKSKDQP